MISLIRQDNFNKTLWLAGTSSDTKPTDVFNYKGAVLPVVNGSAFLEVDTSTYYVFDAENGEWFEQSSGGGGGTEPEGSIEITANGTYNVKRKAQAIVNVPNDVASFIEATPAVMNNDDVTTVKRHAFRFQDTLQSVTFNNVKRVGYNAFYACLNLTDVTLPECLALGSTGSSDEDVFHGCNKLKTVIAPKCVDIGGGCFQGCRELETLNMPNVEIIRTKAFQMCVKLSKVEFKKLNSAVEASAFYQDGSLVSADLGGATGLGKQVFRYCRSLATLILRKTDAICTLSNVNSFEETLIQTGNGFIYVPRALVDTYKSATNWSIYAAYFRALEDYTVDGTTTGDLDPSKI